MKTHFRGVLNSQMAKTAQAKHRNQVSGARAAAAEGVEGGDAGTHQRGGVGRGQVRGHECNCTGWGKHVFGISAVVGDTRCLGAHASEDLSAAAMVTIAAVAAVPSHADALARLPGGDSGPDRVDHSGHFVTWNAWILNARKEALFGDGIAMADTASLHLDSDGAGDWLRDGPLN